MLLMFKNEGFKTLDPNTSRLHFIRNTYSHLDLAIQPMTQIQYLKQWKCNPEGHVVLYPESILLDI